jgi:murein DD-endopeptidase MepM/ murein hydrolase activator NlpD
MSVLQEIPRAAVRSTLWAARLPLTLAEAVRGADPEWPPAIAFDALAAEVRELAGGMLRDDELVRAGRLQRARVEELRRAADLEAAAAETREEADEELRARRERDARQRASVERQTRQRAQAARREKSEQQAGIAAEAHRRKQAVRRAETATKERVAGEERAARLARLDAEDQALREERRAVAASGAAVDADRELEERKAARRS